MLDKATREKGTMDYAERFKWEKMKGLKWRINAGVQLGRMSFFCAVHPAVQSFSMQHEAGSWDTVYCVHRDL